MYVGIDVGTRLVGWASVDENGEVEDSSVALIEGSDLQERYENLVIWARKFFHFSCFELGTAVGLECPWYGQNIQTALKLGEAKGIIRAMALWHGMKVVDVSPAEAKKALTGRGNANKEEMLRVAKTLSPGIDSFDEADAFGVALAVRDSEMSAKLEASGGV